MQPDAYRRRFVLVLTIGLLAVFLLMISGLLLGVVFGVLLWAFTRGLYSAVLRRVRERRGLAATLSLIVTTLLVVVPATLLIALMAADAASLARSAGEWLGPYRAEVESRLDNLLQGGGIEILGFRVTAADVADQLGRISATVGGFLISLLQGALGGIARAALVIGVTLYTLFFFYLDGDAFLQWTKRLLPLAPHESDRLVTDFFATSRASLKAIGVIGLVQGGMGGLAFWVCGIPAPFFWAMVMAVASTIPAVGVQIIVFPAVFVLLLIGKTWFGIGLFLWSVIAIANADNLLRPYLVRREVNLHELVVFLSTIGGIATFGFFGVIIGPVIASLLKASLHMYTEMYGAVAEPPPAPSE